jgi:hypothetical protein
MEYLSVNEFFQKVNPLNKVSQFFYFSHTYAQLKGMLSHFKDRLTVEKVQEVAAKIVTGVNENKKELETMYDANKKAINFKSMEELVLKQQVAVTPDERKQLESLREAKALGQQLTPEQELQFLKLSDKNKDITFTDKDAQTLEQLQKNPDLIKDGAEEAIKKHIAESDLSKAEQLKIVQSEKQTLLNNEKQIEALYKNGEQNLAQFEPIAHSPQEAQHLLDQIKKGEIQYNPTALEQNVLGVKASAEELKKQLKEQGLEIPIEDRDDIDIRTEFQESSTRVSEFPTDNTAIIYDNNLRPGTVVGEGTVRDLGTEDRFTSNSIDEPVLKAQDESHIYSAQKLDLDHESCMKAINDKGLNDKEKIELFDKYTEVTKHKGELSEMQSALKVSPGSISARQQLGALKNTNIAEEGLRSAMTQKGFSQEIISKFTTTVKKISIPTGPNLNLG